MSLLEGALSKGSKPPDLLKEPGRLPISAEERPFNKEVDLRARDFMLCAVAVPISYLLFFVLSLEWESAVAVMKFLESTPTNAASFTFVCFVFTVLSGGFAVAVVRKLKENHPRSIDSWKEWRAIHYKNFSVYGVAFCGLLLGAMQLYMLLTMPARPPADTFRAWISIDGIAAGAGCFIVMLVDFCISLWKAWKGCPPAWPRRLQVGNARLGGQIDYDGRSMCGLPSVSQKTDVLG